MIEVPIVVNVCGEGGSGGALGLAIGDRILMHEFAVYSVIPPEGCAAILWRDSGRKVEAAEALEADGARPAEPRHHRRDRPGTRRRRAHQPVGGGDAARRRALAGARRESAPTTTSRARSSAATRSSARWVASAAISRDAAYSSMIRAHLGARRGRSARGRPAGAGPGTRASHRASAVSGAAWPIPTRPAASSVHRSIICTRRSQLAGLPEAVARIARALADRRAHRRSTATTTSTASRRRSSCAGRWRCWAATSATSFPTA